MIRQDHDKEGLTDDEVYEILKPAIEEFRKYLTDELIYDYFAKYLSIYFNRDAIWENTTLEYEYIDSIQDISQLPKYNGIDIEKLKSILEKKHSLKITSVNPLRIEKI